MEQEEKVFVGIDVSKDYLDINAGKVAWREKNDKKGLKRIGVKLQKLSPTLVVVESTGGYENALLEALWEKEIAVAHVNPRRTKAFALSSAVVAKTDKIDAKLLREFAARMNPSPTPPPSAALRKLRSLVTRRSQLVEMRAAEKIRAAHPSMIPEIKATVRQSLKFFTTQIKMLESQIASTINSSPELKERADILQKETGVGPVLLMTLLAQLPELGTVSRERIAALVGVAPMDRQSGNTDSRRLTKGGRVNVRTSLYMATLSAARRNPKLKAFYLSLLRRGKLKKVALVATMRRFLVHLNALLRTLLPHLEQSQAA